MLGSVITIKGNMYLVKRTFREERIKKIDNWQSYLKQYYHADVLFKRDGYLYLCNTIDALDSEPIP
tara:strand:- start:2114 stop:2311 length:198 start_codon:yes stop_codon:yes gene_type:complete